MEPNTQDTQGDVAPNRDASTPPAEPPSARASLERWQADQAVRDGAAETIYGNSFLAAQIDRRQNDLFDGAGWTQDEFASFKRDALDVQRSTGLDEQTSAMIARKFVDGLLAARRTPDPAKHAAETDQASDANNAQIRSTLRLRYGARQAEDLLARSQKFARSHPALSETLKAFGVGSDPEVVLAVADHVRRTNYR
jgi:hypothetical protein